LVFASVCAECVNAAEPTYELQIPAATADESLRALARVTGHALLYRSTEVGVVQTRGLSGSFTLQQALAHLLQDTNLSGGLTEGGVIAVSRSSSQTTNHGETVVMQVEKKSVFASMSAFALGLLGSPSQAQETTSNVVLDEVVVTAQKRTESIQSVPASVSFVDAVKLASQGAKSMQDYAAYVPGLQVDSAGTPGQTTITLRGIAPLGSGSAVGTYIDDAPLGSSGFYAMANGFQLDLLPYDLRGVEVLRGPQGTLYGASTMGGLVKYVLIKPDSSEFAAALGGDVSSIRSGSDAGVGGRGMVNIPIIQGTLAVRASGFYQKTPGFIDNPGRSQKDINEVSQQGGRLALGWTPTANLDVTIEAMRQEIDSDGNSVVLLDPVTERPLDADLNTRILLDEPFQQETDFLKGAINWSVPFGTVSSVSSYGDSRNRQAVDVSVISGGAFLAPQVVDIHLRKFTQELRLASNTDQTVEWMLGGFYTLERVTNDQYVGALDFDLQPIDGFDPLLAASIPSRYEEEAVFGNLTWRLTDRLSVNGGVRFSRNEQHYTQFTSGVFGIGDGGGSSKEDVTTYSSSIKYELTDDAMIYARVASGYQPGGPNVAAANVPPTVGPSKLVNYEAGFKTRGFQNRLALDVSLFRMDWKDIQVLAMDPVSNTNFLINGGEARSEGVEASVTLRPVEQIVLAANFAYTDAKFTVNIPELNASAGQRLPHVPRYAASGTIEYSFDFASDWEARIGGGVRFTDERPAYLFSPVAPPLVYQERSYVALDLNANVMRDGWRVGLFARNLLDKRSYTTYTPVSGVQLNGAVLQPRTLGLSIDRSF
jgi:outer membrane receptor protein involved in Fe transport